MGARNVLKMQAVSRRVPHTCTVAVWKPPLARETGRYTRPVTTLEHRICKLCNENFIENEIHVLLICEFYSDLRHHILQQAAGSSIIESLQQPGFNKYSALMKYQFIIQSPQLQYDLGKLILKMFMRKRRTLASQRL